VQSDLGTEQERLLLHLPVRTLTLEAHVSQDTDRLVLEVRLGICTTDRTQEHEVLRFRRGGNRSGLDRLLRAIPLLGAGRLDRRPDPRRRQSRAWQAGRPNEEPGSQDR
jgi:hypothetical protein